MFKGGENKKMKQDKVRTKAPDTNEPFLIKCLTAHQCKIFASVKLGDAKKVSPDSFEKMVKHYWELVK